MYIIGMSLGHVCTFPYPIPLIICTCSNKIRIDPREIGGNLKWVTTARVIITQNPPHATLVIYSDSKISADI
jgi:hypothetical protein